MAASSDDKSLALYCDFENIALGVRDAKYQKFDIHHILERLLVKGSIVVKKAYCDWDRYKNFKGAMHEAAFELIEIPHVRMSGKNSADIRMVVDALDLCYTKSHVDTFVIISGDSDFSPLVSKLRENAKTVIGVGVKNSTSDLLISSCDEFIYYDDLVRELEKQAPRRKRASKKRASSRTRTEVRVDAKPEESSDDKEPIEVKGSPAKGGVGTSRGADDGESEGKLQDEMAADGKGVETRGKGAKALDAENGLEGKSEGGARDRGRKRTAEPSEADVDAPTDANGEGGEGEPTNGDDETGESKAGEGKAGKKTGRSRRGARRSRTEVVVVDETLDAAVDAAGAPPTEDAMADDLRTDATALVESADGVDDANGMDEEGDDGKREELAQEGLDMLLETAVALSTERGGADKLWGSMVKQTLKRRRPGFNETYYGYDSFGKMLEEAAARGYLALEHDDRSGGYIITKITG